MILNTETDLTVCLPQAQMSVDLRAKAENLEPVHRNSTQHGE